MKSPLFKFLYSNTGKSINFYTPKKVNMHKKNTKIASLLAMLAR